MHNLVVARHPSMVMNIESFNTYKLATTLRLLNKPVNFIEWESVIYRLSHKIMDRVCPIWGVVIDVS